MFFIVSKILSFLIAPMLWVLVLIALAYFIKKRRKPLLIAACIVFYFFSNEFIFMEFMRIWEVKPMDKIEKKQEYDIGIVLGGYAKYDVAYDLIGFHESSDRIFEALRLYHTKRIKKIFLVGGSGSITDTTYKEATFIHNFLLESGIPARDILLDSISKNTYQNAVEASKLLKNYPTNKKLLLITSGYHMRRAKACFEKMNLNTTSYSVDRTAGPRKFQLDHLLLPNSSTLNSWNKLIHEWVGYIVYSIAGYI